VGANNNYINYNIRHHIVQNVTVLYIMLVLYIKKHSEVTAYNTLYTKEEITLYDEATPERRET
jgi:hypothetical protein